MPTWAWIVIGIAVAAALAVTAAAILVQERTRRLRSRFGPEYDRTLEAKGRRRDAEAELAGREERRAHLEVRPLPDAARARYRERWAAVQTDFVDSPATAVRDADALIQSVMADRGYPVEDFEQRAADVSVDHPDVVEHYREGHRLAVASTGADGATEELRQAMRHYRRLFEELVSPAEDEPTAPERRASGDRPKAVR